MKTSVLFLLVLLATSGCSIYHVNSQDTTIDYHPSKKSANEVIYLEQIDRPHEVIGYITVNTERRQYLSEVLEKMKREAAILGGDAITNIRSDATGQWKKLPGQDLVGNAYVRANFSASAIIFK